MTRRRQDFYFWTKSIAYSTAGVALLIITQLLPSYETFKGVGFSCIVGALPIATASAAALDAMGRGKSNPSKWLHMSAGLLFMASVALICIGLGALLEQRDHSLRFVYCLSLFIGFSLVGATIFRKTEEKTDPK